MTSETAFANPDPPPAAGHVESLSSDDDNVPNTAFSKRFIHTILTEATSHFSDFSAQCEEKVNEALMAELSVFAEMTSDRSVRDFLRDAKGPCAQTLAQLTLSMQDHWPTPEHEQCPIAAHFLGLFRQLIEEDASSLPFDRLTLCHLALRALRCMDPSVLEATCVILLKLAENNALLDELYEYFEADKDLMTNVQFILANSLRPRLLHSLWRLLAVLVEQSNHSGPVASSTSLVHTYYPTLTDVFFAYEAVEVPVLLSYARIVLVAVRFGMDVPSDLMNAVQSALSQNLEQLRAEPERVALYQECFAVYNRFINVPST